MKPLKNLKKSTSITPTFNAQAPDRVLTLPLYREHLDVLYDTRLSKTSQDLLQDLFKNDPDVSAAVGSYLTLSDTPISMMVYTYDGELDPAGTIELTKLVRALKREMVLSYCLDILY